jgi:alpha-D-ribose 1-methylphosphonate 5-triphosphate diphosphatase
MTVDMVGNVRAVLAGRIVEGATVAHEDGVLLSIEQRSYRGAVDGMGALCLPGLIDTHCDALEREIFPRRSAELDAGFALRCLESRFMAAGVTTALHGVHFGDTYEGRSLEVARRETEVIADRRRGDRAMLDHRILYRIGARNRRGLDEALNLLGRGQGPCDTPLMSFEDHTPGQGQYRDLEKFKEAIAPEDLPPGEDPDSFVAKRMAAARQLMPALVANREKLSALAAEGAARILAHDPDSPEAVRSAHEWGVAVAEFPVTVEAAEQARDLGMPVVMGAPNVMRRGSHSGNVSAEELVARSLCTSLASDYHPASLLAAVFGLADRGVCSLTQAVGLVTSGPAEVAGLDDRGRLEPGLRADFVLVQLDGEWPAVRAAQRGATCWWSGKETND